MNNETKAPQETEGNPAQNQETVTVHNPFKPGEDKQISKDELDNEQKFKEALTERD